MSSTSAPTGETARNRTTKCNDVGTDTDGRKTSIVKNQRKELANARWAILRDALLKKVTDQSSQQYQHSIRRFTGYDILKKREFGVDAGGRIFPEPQLKEYRWDTSKCLNWNLERLEIAVLAMASCFPKGKCLDVVVAITRHSSSLVSPASTQEWFEALQVKCQQSVCIWKIEEVETKEDPTEVSLLWTTKTTLLVQESSDGTKYTACWYDLDGSTIGSDGIDGNSNSNKERRQMHSCVLWTREPRETKLSLDDLVSHRKTGVDNTGNICVWDSERTLAYLLYHHLNDFAIESVALNKDSSSEFNVLELGTGMAGLAAIALGLRLVQEHQNDHTCGIGVNVFLTDGNANGVKNNAVNQYLTNLYSKAQPGHPYQFLIVSCKLLLWDTDIESSSSTIGSGMQDVILVSDCTHFQDFHSALAITTLRSLRVGGSAIFCQPTRGTSLENFVALINCANSSQCKGQQQGDSSMGKTEPLVSCRWWSHCLLDEKHHAALKEHHDIYVEDLHRPKILIVTKLRDLAEQDRQAMMNTQQHRQI